MILAGEHIDAMIDHALEDLPNECCGLLAGEAGRVTEVHRARSRYPSPTYYLVHPDDQFKIMMDVERRGLGLVGIYHSHTHIPPVPSLTDVREAHYPDLVYVIVGDVATSKPTVRGWRIVDNYVKEEPLTVPGGSTSRSTALERTSR